MEIVRPTPIKGGGEADGDVLINKSAGTVTLASNADWNATSQDVTITSGTLASATYNITTNSFTVNGGTFTGGSGTVTTSGPMAVSSGTFTGGAGNVTVNSTFTLSGGTFTSTSGVLKIYRTSTSTIFTVSGGTFNHNNGTFQVDGSGAVTLTLDVPTTLMLYNIVINTTGYQFTNVTPATGDTIIAENDFTHTSGTLQGTWEVQGDVIIGSLASNLSGGTLTYTTGGPHTYAYTAGGVGPHLRVNHASAVVTPASGTTNLNLVSFSLLAGTFTAPTGTLETYFSFNSTSATVFLVASGATFNHNNGTLKIAGGDAGTFTLDVPTTLTLYDVVINTSVYCFTIVTTASGDNITTANNFTHTCGVLGGTWQVQGNYTVGVGAGAGSAGITFTGGNNQTYTDLGGDEANGDVTINKTPGSSVTLKSNADWNAGSQDVTITSGELNMGASSNISTTTLTVGTAGHLSNNGTGDLTLAGTLTNSGSIRFLGNGTCGGADDILIRSSSTGVQRSWNGTGSFTLQDVDVRDMAGSASITLYSSTSTANNGANWTFSGAGCPVRPPTAGLSTGKINMQSGKLQLQ